MRTTVPTPHHQAGATLVIGLVLLAVLTLLGVSGMSTAILEHVVANNAQFQRDAFEAAATGIEIAVADRLFASPGEVTVELAPGREVQIITTFEAVTDPPPGCATRDPAALDALHFHISAIGRGARGAVSSQHQGLYVLAPRGSSPAELVSVGRVVRTYWSQEAPD